MENSVLDSQMHESNFSLPQDAVKQLRNAAKWARFLAILGIIFSVILAFSALFLGSLLAANFQDAGLAVGAGVITFIYLFSAALFFLPNFFLYRFATKALRSEQSYSSANITESMKNLNYHFAFWGILWIIYFSMIILTILGSLFA